MRYSGSKKRFMKDLLPILMKGTKKETLFIDAFGGGMNVVSQIPLKNKIAIELNSFIVSLWKELQMKSNIDDVIPQELSEEEYYQLKQRYIDNDTKGIESLIGYVGSACSYGGAWWNGYAKFNPKKNEDHIKEAYNGLKKHIKGFYNFEETSFINDSYLRIEEIIKERGCEAKDVVIYCDPPYASTKKYESDFNHIEFWEWCREMSKKGYKVYISEYNAPSDFKCIWKKEKKDGMGTTSQGNKQKTKIEKLFKYNGKN